MSQSPAGVTEQTTVQRDPSAAANLRCQWCFTTLPSGTATCPTCGSPGVPDPRFSSEVNEAAAAAPEMAPTPTELVEWWREDETDGSEPKWRALMSEAEADRRRMQ